MWPFGGQDSGSTSASVQRDSPNIDSCPVDEGTRKAWLAQSSTSKEESHEATTNASSAYAFLNAKAEPHNTITSNTSGLSRERVISSIPRWSTEGSSTEKDTASATSSSSSSTSNWVYPSPNQFFSAMSRKNHNPRAEDMNVVVPIHNAVNERAWKEILEWEKVGDEQSWELCGGPKLVSFKGRPKDITWKAWSKSLLG
jgi:cytochrome c heme-lyase